MATTTAKGMIAKPETQIQKIEDVLAEASPERLRELTTFRRTMAVATAMQQLRELVDGPILDTIISLANTPLGFQTDRPPGSVGRDGKPMSYTKHTIRDCAIEAMLRGAAMIGNEWNIIAGRCYLTKEFYVRKVREFPGLTELRLMPGVPLLAQGGALVPFCASWKLAGQPDEIRCVCEGQVDNRIVVRVNAGMGADAIIGKATRKMLARVYGRVTGSGIILDEQEEAPPEQAAAQQLLPDGAVKMPQTIEGDLQRIADCDSIREVDEMEFDLIPPEGASKLSADEAQQVIAACDKRREEIRASRGERSNCDDE